MGEGKGRRSLFAASALLVASSAGAAVSSSAGYLVAQSDSPAQDAPVKETREEAAPVRAAVTPLPYMVTINGASLGDAVLLQLDNGRLLARQSDFIRWRLSPPTVAAYLLDGEPYFPLDSEPGFKASLDAARQTANFEFAIEAFTVSHFNSLGEQRTVKPQRANVPGGFFNYGLFGTYQEQGGGGGGNSNLNGDFELGAFNSLGVITSQWAGLNLAGNQPSGPFSDRRLVRLLTTFTHDNPDNLTSLELGDVGGYTGLVGRAVLAGGVRYGTKFGTQPGFLTVPLPALAGATSLPSVADIYIDGVRQQSYNLAPGPFQLDTIPVLNGLGEVQVVVRDLLGREQVITQSYLSSARQLRQGVQEFSYEAGAERRRFGTASEDYGAFVATGTHRYGFSDHFTGEARAEFAGDGLQGLSVGGILGVVPLGIFSSSVAASHSRFGVGWLGAVGFERGERRGVNVGARAQFASADFRQVGLNRDFSLPIRTLGANIGYSFGRPGAFGLSYFQVANRGVSSTSIVTGTYSVQVMHSTVSLLVADRLQPTDNLSATVRFSMPFGGRTYTSASYREERSSSGRLSGQTLANVQLSVPIGEGYGYRASVGESHSDGGDSSVSGSLSGFLNGPYGSYAAEYSRFDDQNAYRASMTGGFGTIGSHAFASRRIDNSFAVVETGAENIELNVYSQRAGKTDASGVAVLPYLQPYQSNQIDVDPNSLPMDVELPFARTEVAPYFRSGVIVSLPARKTLNAMLTLLQPNGNLMPAGATVTFGDQEFAVGNKGRAYVSGLKVGDNDADVRWGDMLCHIRFDLPANAGFQPEIGPVQCTGSTP